MRSVIVFAAVCALAVSCSAQEPHSCVFVSISQRGWGYANALTASGDHFTYHSETGWEFVGNIKVSSGYWTPGQFVGLSFWIEDFYHCTPNSPAALTNNGDYFYRDASGTWEYEGNIGDLSGIPPDSEFVSLSFSAYSIALTGSGEFYIRSGGGWQIRPAIECEPGLLDAGDDMPNQSTILRPNYPNPFNPGTTISFELPELGPVRLEIYTAAGALVTTLVDESLSGGPHEITWDGRDTGGRQVASGAYFYQLMTRAGRETRAMVLVK